MRLDWLSSWLGSWPKDLPRLYPQLDDRLLSCFLSDAEFRSVLKLPIVAILPLYSEQSAPADRAFGAGLARLLIRDLMLLDSLSVLTPENVPQRNLEKALAEYERDNRGMVWVSGSAHVEDGLCKVDFQIFAPGKPPEAIEVRGSMFRDFVSECATVVAEAVGAKASDTTRQMWKQGRPANVVNLLHFGKLLLDSTSVKQRSREAVQLWESDPDFSPVLQAVMDQEPQFRVTLLQAYERDPYNVALLCQLALAVRETQGHEPYAVQFARKAIELSPGCGRAHLAMPESAHPDANLLRHAELAYRLLPGCPDALTSYLATLCRAGKSAKELTPVLRELINLNPYDPDLYQRAIDTFSNAKQFRYALDVAKGLQQLFEPEVHPQTQECLNRSPKLHTDDPVREIRALMRRLRESIAGKG